VDETDGSGLTGGWGMPVVVEMVGIGNIQDNSGQSGRCFPTMCFWEALFH